MYVCVCNGYRDHELRRAAREGARCPQSAFATLGGEPRCGSCLDVAQALIEETLAQDRPLSSPEPR